MQEHSPEARFVIGVRHPILMLQSFYNYRVTEIYERMLDEAIPSFDDVLMMKTPWKGISLDAARFELFLMQFAKTMTPNEMTALMSHDGYDIAIQPIRFEIFLYDLEQLRDSDNSRSASFRQGLSTFLQLDSLLDPFGHKNMNYFVGQDGFPETIDICSPRYEELCRVLLEKGAETARWLEDEFLESESVTVSNRDHFVALLTSWGQDPCLRNQIDGQPLRLS